MSETHIELAEPSIKQVVDMCNRMLRECADNDISVRMANGISDYVVQQGRLSIRQAKWVCQNMDYRGIKRPRELRDVVVAKPSPRKDPEAEIVAEPQDAEQSRRLRRIEKDVKRILDLVMPRKRKYS